MIEVSLKQALNKFKPARFAFVISVDENNKPSGMIAGQIMRCSSQPPLYAVSLAKSGQTYKLIQQSKEFVVATPTESLRTAVDIFASHHGNEIDKFAEAKIKTAKARHIKTPLLSQATINLECKLQQEVDAGDHIIFIGEVLASHLNEEEKILFNMGKVNDKRIYKKL